MKKPKLTLFLIFLLSFVIFYPSLFNFYTNDDFFHLKISEVSSLGGFLNFFNIFNASQGNASYRPISTQVFFFIGQFISKINPIWMHIILFILFFGIIYLVYILTKQITKNVKISLLSTFLYAVSSTHFSQLNFLSSQEIWLTFFALSSIVLFIKFLEKKKYSFYILSLLTFFLSLLSKESAVVIPFLIILVYSYLKLAKRIDFSINKFFKSSVILFLILFFYLYFHFFKYGLQGGESYIWDFSFRIFNTLFWYLIWSLNFPEMLVDFIGPGLNVNLGPLIYWKNYLLTIIITNIIFGIIFLFSLINFLKKIGKKEIPFILFGVGWFIASLLPVLFLPWHKFVYYLALPLVGITLLISYIAIKSRIKTRFLVILGFLWLIASVVNVSLSSKTSWITQGAITANKVNIYINSKYGQIKDKKTVLFYDTVKDKDLPWSPSEVVKTTLSDNNFFQVFFPQITAYYGETDVKNPDKIYSRQFLGY